MTNPKRGLDKVWPKLQPFNQDKFVSSLNIMKYPLKQQPTSPNQGWNVWNILKMSKSEIKYLLILFRIKKPFFGCFCEINYTNLATTNAKGLNKPEVWWIIYTSKDFLTISLPNEEEIIFQNKRYTIFYTASPPSCSPVCNILATIAPNWMRTKPIETRHLDLSNNIRFEEI